MSHERRGTGRYTPCLRRRQAGVAIPASVAEGRRERNRLAHPGSLIVRYPLPDAETTSRSGRRRRERELGGRLSSITGCYGDLVMVDAQLHGSRARNIPKSRRACIRQTPLPWLRHCRARYLTTSSRGHAAQIRNSSSASYHSYEVLLSGARDRSQDPTYTSYRAALCGVLHAPGSFVIGSSTVHPSYWIALQPSVVTQRASTNTATNQAS